jgi:hypothetical protein
MTDPEYSRDEPPDEEKARMVALGGSKTPGMFATFATFECNEFQRKNPRSPRK